jgi:hypothetical protein
MSRRRFASAHSGTGILRCVTIEHDMTDREIIIGVLRNLSHRLWLDRMIQETALMVCVVLFSLVCFQLIEPALASSVPSNETVIRIALWVMITAVAVEAVRRSARRVTTEQAAVEADARAQLKDELKSAHWFLTQEPISPFAALHVQRAAQTAAGLDLALLAPRRLPGNALLAGGFGLLLAVLVWITPQLSRSWDSGPETGSGRQGEPSDLRSLLADAPQAAAIEKLDLALRTLQQSGVSTDEKTRALADARDAIDQANMDAFVARDELANLAESLKAEPKFESVAKAMSGGRIENAMMQLSKLKADTTAREVQPAEPAAKAGEPETDLGPAQEDLGRDLNGKSAAVNQDAINRVITALERASERIEIQNRANSVKRRMADSLIATNQRSQLTASQFDNRINAPNPTPSPDTGSADVRGGTLFRQAAVARDENDTGHEGSQSGDASGDSTALPLEGEPTRRLDAQLKRESIAQNSDAGDETIGKGDQGRFYSASRQRVSMVPASNVRTGTGYDREDETGHDRVPMRQKNLVKDYFLKLHESENK